MKLLACIDCGDIFNLTYSEKSCGCGKTKGRYINEMDAEYSGNAQPIGIANSSFRTALVVQRHEDTMPKSKKDCCKGVEFTAFFIPKAATSLIKID